MKQHLGIGESWLRTRGAINTAIEIEQQPAVWLQIGGMIKDRRMEIDHFIQRAKQTCNRIILTGAGTSSYIGLSARAQFQRHLNLLAEAIPTTDIVSHPDSIFRKSDVPLVVSFARSGNSPESRAAINMVHHFCTDYFHLIITCNGDNELVKYPSKNKFLVVLPPESNDKSLAMTSSYSGMLLAALLIAQPNQEHVLGKLVEKSILFLRNKTESIKEIAQREFNRAVFLGSGPLYGTATESHLKVQELTDGKVIGCYDSFLSFRHGPKAVVNETTLVVYLFSNALNSFQYEVDLITSMNKGRKPLLQVGIFPSQKGNFSPNFDFSFYPLENDLKIDEHFLTLINIIPAQLIGFFKSLQLGLSPDSPSQSGAISRVVEGVKIYPYHPN